jgi:hypothetical protein
MGVMAACLGAFCVWLSGRLKANNYDAVLLAPPVRQFAVSVFDVLLAIKEAMQNNFGDNLQTQKSCDSTADEEGSINVRYNIAYEEIINTLPPSLVESQLIVDIEVSRVASLTRVKLTYSVVTYNFGRSTTSLLADTTDLLWSCLDSVELVQESESQLR